MTFNMTTNTAGGAAGAASVAATAADGGTDVGYGSGCDTIIIYTVDTSTTTSTAAAAAATTTTTTTTTIISRLGTLSYTNVAVQEGTRLGSPLERNDRHQNSSLLLFPFSPMSS